MTPLIWSIARDCNYAFKVQGRESLADRRTRRPTELGEGDLGRC